jgi:lysophospholipase L1-like esterase
MAIDTVLEGQAYPVNELGEIVMQAGVGTSNVVGFLPSNFIPTDYASKKMVVVGAGGATAVATATTLGLVKSGTGLAVAGDGTLSTAGLYLGPVATGCGLHQKYTNTSAFIYSRNVHFARDTITALKLVFPAWYVNPTSSSGSEGGSGSASTFSASIEYPVGVFTQVTFGGSAYGVAASGATLVSDFVAVNIPDGARFWTRNYQQSPGGIYFGSRVSDGTGENRFSATSFGDFTMTASSGVNTVSAGSSAGTSTGPCAILGMTNKKTVAIYGDSIAAYVGDKGDAAVLQNYIERAIGGKYAYMNLAQTEDRAFYFVASHSRRVPLADYCSHVIVEYGINDIWANGRTAAQLSTDIDTIISYFPSKPVAVCTLLPYASSSTDGYTTVAGQTISSFEAIRSVVNAQRRNGINGATAIFDGERAVESGYQSGTWNVITGATSPATANFTVDGLHPQRTAHIKIAQSLNIAAFI